MAKENGVLYPALGCVAVHGRIEWLGNTASECHHLAHDGHVELTPGQFSSVSSHACVVLLGELEGAWPVVEQRTPASIRTEFLYFALFLQIDGPVFCGGCVFTCCQDMELSLCCLINIYNKGTIDHCEMKKSMK